MNFGAKLLIGLAVLVFAGYVIYGSMARATVRCEVCLEFDQELVCRKGAGETEAEALRAAQESTCGGNARGMSEVTACRSRPPERAYCSTS